MTERAVTPLRQRMFEDMMIKTAPGIAVFPGLGEHRR
jgi:hypothetical protein